jgi:hypothetical protein
MNDLRELNAFRAEVPRASAEVWANARSALARAVLAELHDHTRADDDAGVIAFPGQARSDIPRGPTWARSLGRGPIVAAVAVAAVAAIVIAGTVVVAGRSGNSPNVRTEASRATSRVGLSGPALRLASYKFRLPAGFKTVHRGCIPTPSPAPSSPMTVLGHFVVAASTDGGCVQAELATPAGVAADARPIQVGAYQGFISSTAPTSETLYVAIAAIGGNHYLVLSATGLSPAQLIAIATTGLPRFPIAAQPTQPCTANCR